MFFYAENQERIYPVHWAKQPPERRYLANIGSKLCSKTRICQKPEFVRVFYGRKSSKNLGWGYYFSPGSAINNPS